MYAPAQFQPANRGAFLPQVRLTGVPEQMGRRYGQAPFLGTVQLGQTAETWYKRARAALERYRFLKNQIETVNNDVARSTIIAWLGSPSVPGTPEYRYATALEDFTYNASPAQDGIQAYAISRRQNRVRELEDFNDQLNQKIESARVTYGSRPAPATPGPVTTPPPAPGPDLTLPILGAAAAVVAAIVLT